jgi:cysteine desulfurase
MFPGEQIPRMPNRIFLDYNSTTPMDSQVFQAMLPFMTDLYGNPHSTEHSYGWEAEKAVEESKTHIAALINALEDEIILTSGATESNNLAIIGVAIKASATHQNRNKIIVSEIEHKCVLGSARFTKTLGYEVIKAPVTNNGIVDIEQLSKLITPTTLLVSVMATNNEIGTNQPLKKIGELCKANGTIFHVDGAQGLYSSLDAPLSGIDLLSLSAHKIYGPKGIGALFINQDLSLKPEPIIHGGGQQNGFRSGTIATPLVVGFGRAAQIFLQQKAQELSRIQFLRDSLLTQLQANFPEIQVNGSITERHPGNLNLFIPGIDAKQVIHKMQPTVAISTGSACTSGIPEPSHVLKAIGRSTRDAESSLRICVGRHTSQNEINTAVAVITQAINESKSYPTN